MEQNWIELEQSICASNTINPIRNIVDKLVKPKDKQLISLAIGDPTVFGNFQPPKQVN